MYTICIFIYYFNTFIKSLGSVTVVFYIVSSFSLSVVFTHLHFHFFVPLSSYTQSKTRIFFCLFVRKRKKLRKLKDGVNSF